MTNDEGLKQEIKKTDFNSDTGVIYQAHPQLCSAGGLAENRTDKGRVNSTRPIKAAGPDRLNRKTTQYPKGDQTTGLTIDEL